MRANALSCWPMPPIYLLLSPSCRGGEAIYYFQERAASKTTKTYLHRRGRTINSRTKQPTTPAAKPEALNQGALSRERCRMSAGQFRGTFFSCTCTGGTHKKSGAWCQLHLRNPCAENKDKQGLVYFAYEIHCTENEDNRRLPNRNGTQGDREFLLAHTFMDCRSIGSNNAGMVSEQFAKEHSENGAGVSVSVCNRAAHMGKRGTGPRLYQSGHFRKANTNPYRENKNHLHEESFPFFDSERCKPFSFLLSLCFFNLGRVLICLWGLAVCSRA